MCVKTVVQSVLDHVREKFEKKSMCAAKGSPNLLNTVLKSIFRRLEWRGKGIKIDSKQLSHLRFADVVIVISEKAEKAKIMLTE